MVLFDRRGIGSSDPVLDWSTPLVAQWSEDLAAIAASVCTRPPVVVSLGDYWGPARCSPLTAGRVEALVLYEPTGPVDPRHLVADPVPSATRAPVDWIARVCPSRATTAPSGVVRPGGPTGASPGVAAGSTSAPEA